MRNSLACALLVTAALAAPTLAVPPGNVNGTAEQPLLDQLQAIRTLEQQARTLALGQAQDAVLPADVGVMVKDKLAMALAGITALKTAIESAAGLQASTDTANALKELEKAAMADTSAGKKIDQGKTADKIVFYLNMAERAKRHAQLRLMGISSTPKDDAALDANGIGNGTVPHDADISGNKKDVSVSKKDVANKKGDKNKGHGHVSHEHYPHYHGSELVTAQGASPPVNAYYAFEGDGAEPGYTFKTFDRQLFGPFETRFQVGSFKIGDTADTGSACVEFDVEGSDPLQFVAVCGRRITGGVQVFVQSHNGAAGNLFLPATTIAQVLVTYSGTQFVVKAASGRGAPDFVLANVATVNLTQGETALVAGIGASGLTKGAEIGLDEIFITAQ